MKYDFLNIAIVFFIIKIILFPMIFKYLNAREKHTFSIGLIAYFFNGLTLGILILQEVILKKTLSGTPLQITILTSRYVTSKIVINR